ncbi:MAG: insulinase family protein [Helicobacteraceae bacterium]|nr:insulinase family protein [Helicobacteraceae bacterium]
MGAEIVNVDGAALIVESDRKLPIISMRILFLASGSINDQHSPGLAQITAAILGEGTKKLGAVKFARLLEEKAVHLSADSTREIFYLDLSSLSEQFNDGFNLAVDLIKNPNLSSGALKKVKTQTIGELMRKENDFDYQASVGLQALLFEKTPLEKPTLGDIKSVEKISLKEVENFIKTSLARERVVVLFGGDIDVEVSKKYTEKLLRVLPRGKKLELARIEARKSPTQKRVKKETKQAYLYFGSPMFMKAGDDETYKATVASYILGGGGFGSRIMEEIRVKRGLAYSAYGNIYLGITHSVFKGHLQTKLESLDEAKKVVVEVIDNFVQKGATEDELNNAKLFLLGSEPLRNETMNQRLSRSFNDYYYGKPQGWHSAQLKKIESLTLSELNDFIKSRKEITNLTYFVVEAK